VTSDANRVQKSTDDLSAAKDRERSMVSGEIPERGGEDSAGSLPGNTPLPKRASRCYTRTELSDRCIHGHLFDGDVLAQQCSKGTATALCGRRPARYELDFFIGPCSEDEAVALAEAIEELPGFKAVGGGCIAISAPPVELFDGC